MASPSDGLTKRILQEAGPAAKAEYDRENSRGLEQSIQTSGGKLTCKHIYFIPCPGLKKNADKWVFRKFVSEAFNLTANDTTKSIQSIAFPAIGCGLIDCDPDFVAQTLITAVIYEMEHRPALQLSVYFVIRQEEQTLFDRFQNQLTTIKSNRSAVSTDPFMISASKLPPKVPKIERSLQTFTVKKHLLESSSDEYARVLKQFQETMKPPMFLQIVRIELIWNKLWYQQYRIHYDEFRGRLGKDTEKWLFHGCSEDAANSILKKTLRSKLCGCSW